MSWWLAWIEMSSKPKWVTQGKSVKKTEDRREGKMEGKGEGDRNREKRKREREEGERKGREIELSKA